MTFINDIQRVVNEKQSLHRIGEETKDNSEEEVESFP